MAAATMKETLFVTEQVTLQAKDFGRWIEERQDGREAQGELHLPPQLADLLMRAMAIIADGGEVQIGSIPEQLTTTAAAGLIGVSRTTLLKMVASGELPATKVRSHTRLHRDDVLQARKDRLTRKQQSLEELIALEDELGL